MGLFWVQTLSVACLAFSVVTGETNDDERRTFIVRVQDDLKPSVFSDVEHWYSTTLQSLRSDSLRGNEFLYVYKTVFNGFSAKLTAKEVEEIKRRPEILGVFPDRVRQIHTTRTPQFLGLNANVPNGLLAVSDFGSNVIIGVIDTGIWPERRSFQDKDLGLIPDHWKGECNGGKKFPKTLCNKKLVGARYFSSGHRARSGGNNKTEELMSAKDFEGHGTHTASTAAGRYVQQASLFGFAAGTAVGMAPKARISVYKVCWEDACSESDILAAFDKAVEDGVDVISISIGGPIIPYNGDPIAIGSFGAMEKGVFVSASAGNAGPGTSTTSNIAPWITTVGAGTIDRTFPADVLLEDGRVLVGASLYSGDPLPAKTFFPLIYGGNASANGSSSFTAAMCLPNALDGKLTRGKIVMCNRGGSPRALKGEVVKEAGGIGMILANVSPEGEGLIADPHFLPAVAITESAANTVHGYLSTSKNPSATLTFNGTQLRVKPAPLVASFSSRGPNMESDYIIKPDIIAPGVNILAAWPEDLGPTEIPTDTRRTEFNILSGTSMACPHVSGVAALLKGAHPDWSPAETRSAMMTTAYTHDNLGTTLLDEATYNTSTVWGMGSGHLNPEKAVDPGLVYNLTVDDYVEFLCASNYSEQDIHTIARRRVNCTGKGKTPWDLNYPSISVAFEQSGPSKFEITVTRTATHVADGGSSYRVSLENPNGAVVTVKPGTLEFRGKGEKQTYMVKISAEKMSVPPGSSRTEFGKLTWLDGKHVVGTPIAVTWRQPS